ncbi:MAG TPA: redoxin family protein [Hanamia sp.]
MKTPLLTMCLLLIFFKASAQQNVKISITNPIAKDGTEIFFCRSINGDPSNYVVMYDKAIFEHGNALKTFKINSPMFIMIADNPFMPKIRLVVCKGDSIHIQVNQDTVANTTSIRFAGNNSMGCQNYYNNALFLGSKTSDQVNDVLKTTTNLKDAIDKTENLKVDLFSSMDSLYSKNEISADYYHYVKLEGDAEFLNAVLRIAFFMIQNSKNEKFKLPVNALKALEKFYCEKYDPFSEKYRNVNYRNANARRKCNLIADGVLNKTKLIYLGLWDNDDTVYHYAPKGIQERMFATELIFMQKFGMINNSDAEKKYEKLKQAFPNSIFLPVIESSFDKDISKIPQFAFGTYNTTSKKFDYIGKDSLTTFPSFIKKHFPNKSVLIDMWATYCSPCKTEFAYAKDVQTFLKNHGIDLLYFSIDNKNNASGWINDIGNFSLNGYHYFATDFVSDYLRSYLGQTLSIPHYLLFNKRGELVDGDLPRPSEKGIFYSTILDKLKK